MLNNLLGALPEGGKIVTIPTAALYALIGFLVVVAGITFLILVVWLVGKVMNKSPMATKTKTEKKEPAVPTETVSESLAVADAEELNGETVAVIMAALMAYYQKNNPKCEFTVKRIKRI
jgi:sodium pump decarboxylase gamma subunit